MAMKGHRAGGGIASKNVTHRSSPKVEPRSRGQNPSAVNQLGNHVGDHITHVAGSTGYRGEPLVRGPGYNNPQGPTSFSNIGPGKGRTIYASGTQCQTGPVNKGLPGLPSTRGQWPDRE
jgi:hypothetical protein